jgi:hypothetical protein
MRAERESLDGHQAPRLVARLYAETGDDTLRARMIECMLRPLSPLGVAAVASGAFLGQLLHGGYGGLRAAAEGAVRASSYTTAQVLELARFVEQVQPAVVHQLAMLARDASPGGLGLSAAALLVLVQRLRSESPASPPARPGA